MRSYRNSQSTTSFLRYFNTLNDLFDGTDEWQHKYLNKRFSPTVPDSHLIAEGDNFRQTQELQTRFQAFKVDLGKLLYLESSLRNVDYEGILTLQETVRTIGTNASAVVMKDDKALREIADDLHAYFSSMLDNRSHREGSTSVGWRERVGSQFGKM